jgi:hypothetical protein
MKSLRQRLTTAGSGVSGDFPRLFTFDSGLGELKSHHLDDCAVGTSIRCDILVGQTANSEEDHPSRRGRIYYLHRSTTVSLESSNEPGHIVRRQMVLNAWVGFPECHEILPE